MSLPSPSPKQSRIIWLALTGLALAIIVGLIVALFWGMGQALGLLGPVLWPIAVAAVLAYLLDPVVDFLESRKVPRTRGIVMVFFCAVMLLIALLGSVVPQLVSETSDLVQRIPDYAQRTQTNVVNWIKNPPAPLRKFLEKRLRGEAATNSLPATNLAVETTNAAPVGANPVTAIDSTGSSTNAAFQWAGLFDEKTLGSTAHWLAEQLPQVGKWIASKLSKVTALFGVLAGQPDGERTVLVDETDDVAVDLADQHHPHDLHGLRGGDPVAAAELALDAELVEVGGDLRTSAVDHYDLDAAVAEEDDVLGEGLLQLRTGHGVAAVLHDHGLAGEGLEPGQGLDEGGGLRQAGVVSGGAHVL